MSFVAGRAAVGLVASWTCVLGHLLTASAASGRPNETGNSDLLSVPKCAQTYTVHTRRAAGGTAAITAAVRLLIAGPPVG